MTERSKTVWMLLLLAAWMLAALGSSLRNEFVRYDDWGNIAGNPGLHPVTWSNLGRFWREPYLSLYAPLAYMLLAAQAVVSDALGGAPELEGGIRPDIYHATSLVLHLVNTALVYRILARLAAAREAWWGVALFALHPLQVESVCWATEQRGLLSHCGVLAALALWTADRPPPARDSASVWGSLRPRAWWLAATACYLLALLSKPTAVALPLMAGVYDLTWRKRDAWSTGVRLLPWVALAGLWILLTSRLQPAEIMTLNPVPWQRLVVIGDALGFYLWQFCFPLYLTVEYGRSLEVVLASTWSYLIAGAVWLAAALALRHLKPIPGRLVVGWALAGLAPVLGLVPFGFQETSTVADRYLYLALLGPAAGAAWAVRRWGRVAAVPLLAALAAWTMLDIRQVGTWRDTGHLADQALRASPRSPGAWHLRALSLEYDQHQLSQAEQAFRQGWEVRPNSGWAAGRLAYYLARYNRIDEAIETSRRGLWLDPQRIEIRRGLATLYADRGELGEATAQMRRVVEQRPKDLGDRRTLAKLLARQGEPGQAAAEYEQIVGQAPDDLEGWRALGAVREQLGQLDAAYQAWQTAAQLDPGDLSSQVRLADLELRLGRVDQGRQHFVQLLLKHPDNVDLRASWGIALVRAQDLPQAARELAWVLERQPEHARALYHWGLIEAARGDRAAAVAAYRKALESDGSLSEALVALAGALAEQSDWPQAIAAYRKAIERLPRQPELRNNLGVILAQLGQADQARLLFQQALALNPDYETARENLKAVRTIAPSGVNTPSGTAPSGTAPAGEPRP